MEILLLIAFFIAFVGFIYSGIVLYKLLTENKKTKSRLMLKKQYQG